MANWFSGSPGSYTTRDLLDPQQRALFNNIGSYYNAAFSGGKGFPQYKGDYTAPMNEAETKAIANQGDLANAYASWRSSFTPDYINPEVDANELRKYNENFYGTAGRPGVRALTDEAFAGNSGYWGVERAQADLNAYKDTVTDPYQNWRSTALQNSYANALNYATTGNVVNTTNQSLQQVPRLIQQYGLDQQYKEWVRTRPETAGNIDAALKFIDLTTTAQEYEPGSNSQWGTVGSIIGGATGIVAAPMTGGLSIPLAASIGGGIGGLFDNNNSGGSAYNIPQAAQNYYTQSRQDAFQKDYLDILKKAYAQQGTVNRYGVPETIGSSIGYRSY